MANDHHGSPYRLQSLLHPNPDEEQRYYPAVGTFNSPNPPRPPSSPGSSRDVARYPAQDNYTSPSSHYHSSNPYYPDKDGRSRYETNPGYPYTTSAVQAPVYGRSPTREAREEPPFYDPVTHAAASYGSQYPPPHEELGRRTLTEYRPSQASRDAPYAEYYDSHNTTTVYDDPYAEYGRRSYRDHHTPEGPTVGFFATDKSSTEYHPDTYRTHTDRYGYEYPSHSYPRSQDPESLRYRDPSYPPGQPPPAPVSSYTSPSRAETADHPPPARTAMSISSLLLNDEPSTPSEPLPNDPYANASQVYSYLPRDSSPRREDYHRGFSEYAVQSGAYRIDREETGYHSRYPDYPYGSSEPHPVNYQDPSTMPPGSPSGGYYTNRAPYYSSPDQAVVSSSYLTKEHVSDPSHPFAGPSGGPRTSDDYYERNGEGVTPGDEGLMRHTSQPIQSPSTPRGRGRYRRTSPSHQPPDDTSVAANKLGVYSRMWAETQQQRARARNDVSDIDAYHLLDQGSPKRRRPREPADSNTPFCRESLVMMLRWHKKTRKILDSYEEHCNQRGLRKLESDLHKLADVSLLHRDALEANGYREVESHRQTDEEGDIRPATKPILAREDSVEPTGTRGTTPLEVPVEEEESGMAADPLWEMRKVWAAISNKQIPRVTRHVSNNQAVRLQNCRRVAMACQRELRRVAIRTAKDRKEMQSRAKRAMREMLVFWKRNEREEKEARKRAEKEAQERLRIEEERREAMRQSRKLNFLISQTEIFSHFVGSKLGTTGEDSRAGTVPPGLSANGETLALPSSGIAPGGTTFEDLDFADADEATLQARAMESAQSALAMQQRNTQAFDANRKELSNAENMPMSQNLLDEMNFMNPSGMPEQAEIKQPKILMCQLKEYQLKGLNWLAHLYEQGINGILADEMGLGKTVQSISLLAYLTEVHNIQGPFMVVAPASTLHNWQQEISRFVPQFKILPYWGNLRDRKVLRKFWNKKTLYSSDPPFNVLITSYQMVVTDEQYFRRIKWQYMVLDEAQAIKSSSSARWKTLLGFHCRNRLLLTGTPIQNSMQELWALLHFIMPTLFDSHEEFSEWFSKDIESHAENKTSLNEHQLSRLHMILKPFMLRRIKKHVQNELGDKIELEVRCDLTPRQRQFYQMLKGRISISDLLAKAASGSESDSATLMNLMMQFRKVCNHPELFERAEVESPYRFSKFYVTPSVSRIGDKVSLPYMGHSVIQYHIPKRLYRDGGILNVPGLNNRAGWLTKCQINSLSIWHPSYIQRSVQQSDPRGQPGAFGFVPFIDYSPAEVSHAFFGTAWSRWLGCLKFTYHWERWFAYQDLKDHPMDMVLPILQGSQTRLILPGTQLELRCARATPALQHMLQVMIRQGPYDILRRLAPAFMPTVTATPIECVCSDYQFTVEQQRAWFNPEIRQVLVEPPQMAWESPTPPNWSKAYKRQGLSNIWTPAADKLIVYSGKMLVLDKLLPKLKAEGHRVLLYFQMTRMIDLMEEYLSYRQYTYLRLDGSSKISDRRDMVTDWQTRDDIFIFLLSTRAGGLGINLTAADTVIFYDSDWNPTVDQQAMDRAHRLGQTRQVTVYRLITRGTVEEKILVRAKQKDEIQKVVIAGGDFKPQVDFKPKEIVSLLLDDNEMGDDTPGATSGVATDGNINNTTTTTSGVTPLTGVASGAQALGHQIGVGLVDVSVSIPQVGEGNPDHAGASTELPPPASHITTHISTEGIRRPLRTTRMVCSLPTSVTMMNSLFDQYLAKPVLVAASPSGNSENDKKGRASSTVTGGRKRTGKAKPTGDKIVNTPPTKRARPSKPIPVGSSTPRTPSTQLDKIPTTQV